MASLSAIQLIFLVVIGQGLFLTFILFTYKKGNPIFIKWKSQTQVFSFLTDS